MENNNSQYNKKSKRDIMNQWKISPSEMGSTDEMGQEKFLSANKNLVSSLGIKMNFKTGKLPQEALEALNVENTKSEEETQEEEFNYLTAEEMMSIALGERIKPSDIGENNQDLSIYKEPPSVKVDEEEMLFKHVPPEEIVRENSKKGIEELGVLSPSQLFEDESDKTSLETPNEVKKIDSSQELPTMRKTFQLNPMELLEDEVEQEVFNQLDLSPIIKQKDIDSPLELLSPDELEVEGEFVSRALPKGSLVKDYYKIIKVLTEDRERVSYLAEDIRTKGKKIILKEYYTEQIPKEEVKNRRNKFHDFVRIINTFNHPNMAKVIHSFNDKDRSYALMERIEGIDLFRLSDMNTKPFTENEVIKWGLELCDSIEFLHYRPTPFTLGNFQPQSIMVTLEGTLKITGYDMQRFFDPQRNLDFVPDNPKKLYSDIMKLSRILYFLLTKNIYNPDAYEIEWPESISKKFKKLLSVTCREGQKTIGSIKEFKEKLTDSQIEDIEEDFFAKNRHFPIHIIDIKKFFIKIKEFFLERPVYLIMVSLAILFVLLFPFIKNITKPKYHRPSGPLVYVSASKLINIIEPKNHSIIHSLPLKHEVSVIYPCILKIKSKKESNKVKEKNVILLGYKNRSDIDIFDSKNLNILGNISCPGSIIRIIDNKERHLLYVLHSSPPQISVIDKYSLSLLKFYPVGNKPLDMAYLPLDAKGKKIRIEMIKKKNASISKNIENQEQIWIPSPMLIVSDASSQGLLFINPANGKTMNKFILEGSPKAVAVSRKKRTVYTVDIKMNNFIEIDADKVEQKKIIPLQGKQPSYITIDKDKNEAWISMSGSNSLNRVNISSDSQNKIKELKLFAREPERLFFNKVTSKIWVLNKRSMDITIIDTNEKEGNKKIQLDNPPGFISLEDIKNK